MSDMCADDDSTPADVPLRYAMLTWNCAENGGGALVVRHPDTSGASVKFQRSSGACNGDPLHRPGNPEDWATLGDAGRLASLLCVAWQAVIRDRVDPKAMHAALMVIPEFRAGMTRDMLPEHYREDTSRHSSDSIEGEW